MQFEFANVLIFLVLAAVFLFGTLLFGWILRPATQDAQKGSIYECGEIPLGQGWFNFNPRFYIVALIFLIFDVEVAFTYPVASIFTRWVAMGDGALAFFEIFTFIAILTFGLVYVWIKGDLEWLKRLKSPRAENTAPAPRSGS